MNLEQLCKFLSKESKRHLSSSDYIANKIMCPEYSTTSQDIKTHIFLKQQPLFALCWVLEKDASLFATILPSPHAFSYHTSIPDTRRTQLHTHDYLELAYIISGQFSQKILGKTITFHAGELCFIDKNCIHQDDLSYSPACILFLGIDNSIFEHIMKETITEQRLNAFLHSALLKQKNLQQYLHFKPRSNTTNILECQLSLLIKELSSYDNASFYICKGLLIRIFRILSTEYDFSLSKELKHEMSWLLFDEITNYIKTHYKNITIQKLCEQFHFQKDYFNRLIKSKTGMTYKAYLQKLRLQKAELLLCQTNYSIEQISDEIGYQNKGYFYKIFMQHYHMTPAQFRKQANNTPVSKKY